MNAGQTCVAPDYLIVHKDIENEFIAHLKVIVGFYDESPERRSTTQKLYQRNMLSV